MGQIKKITREILKYFEINETRMQQTKSYGIEQSRMWREIYGWRPPLSKGNDLRPMT